MSESIAANQTPQTPAASEALAATTTIPATQTETTEEASESQEAPDVDLDAEIKPLE